MEPIAVRPKDGFAALGLGMVHETERETRLKQVKQPVSCFIDAGARFIPVKHNERRETAKNEACFIVSSPKGQTRETELPAACADGLRRLRSMPGPRLMGPDFWPLIVADALGLAGEGWAAKAMALGWTELDVFGAVPNPAGDPAGDGLAVWLEGRRLKALCGTYAVVEDVGGGKSYFNRRESEGRVLFWELGR